jgi:E3 ubiquitin-protein ligase UBR7
MHIAHHSRRRKHHQHLWTKLQQCVLPMRQTLRRKNRTRNHDPVSSLRGPRSCCTLSSRRAEYPPSQDWYHESCCNLRDRPSSREPTPVATEPQDDNASEASSSGLPPPLISGDDYESFVCAACAFSQHLVQTYAGTPGAVIVVRDSPTDPWRMEQGIPPTESNPIDIVQQPTTPPPSSPATGSKRLHSPSEHSPGGNNKRAKISCEASTCCLAPPPNPIASKIYTGGLEAALDPSQSLGTGDIFFIDGFRDRWCRCSKVKKNHSLFFLSLTIFSSVYHYYKLDRIYSKRKIRTSHRKTQTQVIQKPKKKTLNVNISTGLSLEELGMRALERIPRDRAIDGIHAFQEMRCARTITDTATNSSPLFFFFCRDDLITFLRPFAQEGKVVNEADIRGFFESLHKK